MKKIRLSRLAHLDLVEIWVYVAEDNLDAADQLVHMIDDGINLLTTSPEIGRMRNEIIKNMRSFPVGNYIVFYRITSKYVEIIRILHGSRDIENIL